jgi:hypothetical protein
MPRAKESRKHQKLPKLLSVQWRRGGVDSEPKVGAPHISRRNRAIEHHRNSTVQGEDQQLQEMIVIEIPQNRPNSDRGVAFPNAETQKGQVPINKGIANADVSSRVASGVFLGQAVKNADGVDEFGGCPAVAPVAQAASNQTVRRPHAASFPGHAPPLERELKIARLRDKIDLRRAKIWKLEEEVNDLQNELETLTTEAMNAADWEEVRASVRRI